MPYLSLLTGYSRSVWRSLESISALPLFWWLRISRAVGQIKTVNLLHDDQPRLIGHKGVVGILECHIVVKVLLHRSIQPPLGTGLGEGITRCAHAQEVWVRRDLTFLFGWMQQTSAPFNLVSHSVVQVAWWKILLEKLLEGLALLRHAKAGERDAQLLTKWQAGGCGYSNWLIKAD